MDLKESEPHALLDLCSQLQSGRHCDPIVCQAKINKYLSRVTSCKTAFLFLVSEEGLELSCGVVGDKPLASDVKIPVSLASSSSRCVSKTSNSLGSAVLENQVISFLELNPAHRQAVLNLLGFPIHSFLCVPISCPDKNESGAPVSLLACLAQKAGRPSFTSRDAALVRECFRVVLGPLMAALACSEERRLRKQCQSLLTVARNLFKHLSELFFVANFLD
ncbi:unnamed protein product [Darwinula stevensoni]|uniref:GAF domain-containing protein n=1 Tax=Darwinula stevensoni TaxID=69355 RepID=A0A7R8X5Q1_9CRUS|nr:unnamed protein product [Darwinula stevensoni]CAG0886160.1 unnamed protein product [Darwinula stevensoni]